MGVVTSLAAALRIFKSAHLAMAAEAAAGSAREVDEEVFNRQIYVVGVDAQRRMASSDILVVGLDGAGAEACEQRLHRG